MSHRCIYSRNTASAYLEAVEIIAVFYVSLMRSLCILRQRIDAVKLKADNSEAWKKKTKHSSGLCTHQLHIFLAIFILYIESVLFVELLEFLRNRIVVYIECNVCSIAYTQSIVAHSDQLFSR